MWLKLSTKKCICAILISTAYIKYVHHYSDVIMGTMASQITGVSRFSSTVCSWTDQRKHQSSASLSSVRGIHRWPMDSSHKGPVTQKMFPVDNVSMRFCKYHKSKEDSNNMIMHILQGCLLAWGYSYQCKWSNPEEYGYHLPLLTSPKHDKSQAVAYFLRHNLSVSLYIDLSILMIRCHVSEFNLACTHE